MKPTFILQEKGDLPFLQYLFPEPNTHFFMRLFLRGSAMDRALGNPNEARNIAEKIVPRKGALIAPRQVHGTVVIPGSSSFALPEKPEGDGVMLERYGVEGSLRFADCFPVIIASSHPVPWIAILHSGYKGVLSNIAGVTCDTLFKSPNRSPSRSFAWIGPGIGRKYYNREKKDPWTHKGMQVFTPKYRVENDTDVFFDLGGQIRNQLLDAGFPSENICSIPLCTVERNDLCYSYRSGDMENRLFLLAFLSEREIPLLGSLPGELVKEQMGPMLSKELKSPWT